MDALDVLLKARDLGGPERKEAIEHIVRHARDLGCSPLVSDSKDGGFKIRYGSIRYAIMDINTKGRVYFHVKAHPNKTLPDDLSDRANRFISGLIGVTIKNGPINCYGQAEEPIETIPRDSLEQFLEYAVGTIQEQYYGHRA